MQYISLAACLLLTSTPVLAAKDCETLKAEIGAKLEAKGVASYSLEVVPKENEPPAVKLAEGAAMESETEGATQQAPKQPAGKAVGSCEGGTKTILYSRG